MIAEFGQLGIDVEAEIQAALKQEIEIELAAGYIRLVITSGDYIINRADESFASGVTRCVKEGLTQSTLWDAYGACGSDVFISKDRLSNET